MTRTKREIPSVPLIPPVKNNTIFKNLHLHHFFYNHIAGLRPFHHQRLSCRDKGAIGQGIHQFSIDFHFACRPEDRNSSPLFSYQILEIAGGRQEALISFKFRMKSQLLPQTALPQMVQQEIEPGSCCQDRKERT